MNKTITMLKRRLRKFPNSAKLFYEIGLEYKDCDRIKLAKRYFMKAIKADPNYQPAYLEAAASIEFNEIFIPNLRRERLAFLRKAIRLDSSCFLSKLNLANDLWVLGRLKESEKYFKEAVNLNLRVTTPYLGYASFLAFGRKNAQLALKYLKRALEIDPNCEATHYRLGKIFLQILGDNILGIKHLKISAEAGHEHAKVLLKEYYAQKAKSDRIKTTPHK